MANIPYKYTQEAQDERDLRAKRANCGPKSRWGWSYSDIPDDRWPFGKDKNKEDKKKEKQ